MHHCDLMRVKINLLSRAYLSQKLLIKEANMGIRPRSAEVLRDAHRLVDHVDNVVEILGEREQLIIKNELINGKTGKWYLGILSEPTYYRSRKKAYTTFFAFLEK